MVGGVSVEEEEVVGVFGSVGGFESVGVGVSGVLVAVGGGV